MTDKKLPAKVDPSGYADALASIPENSLSERQQRIAIGLAMIRDGESCLAASKACGIPNSTLRRYNNALAKVSSEADGREIAIQDLGTQVTVAAQIATERVLERLVDPEHDWRDGDLIKAQQINVDKTLQLNGYKAPTDDGASALGKLLQEANVTLTKKDPSAEAIDVTPTDGDE